MASLFLNRFVSFSSPVDATQAGEGQIEIAVNHGAVPNTAQMTSKGVFAVSFVPKEAKPHSVEVRFNGKIIPRKFWFPASSELICRFQFHKSNVKLRVHKFKFLVYVIFFIITNKDFSKCKFNVFFTNILPVSVGKIRRAVLGGAIVVPVVDVSRVVTQYDVTRLVPVGRPATIHVTAQGAGEASLIVKVTGIYCC